MRCEKEISGICPALCLPACHPEVVKKKHPAKHLSAHGTCPGGGFSGLAITGFTRASVEADSLFSLIHVGVLSVLKVIFCCYYNETWICLFRFLFKSHLVFPGRIAIGRSPGSLALNLCKLGSSCVW